MKKPAYLEITEDELHWFRPSRKARLALRIKRAKRILFAVGRFLRLTQKVIALPILVGFIYFASIHHEPHEFKKFQSSTLDQQIDRAWAISWLNTGHMK